MEADEISGKEVILVVYRFSGLEPWFQMLTNLELVVTLASGAYLKSG